MFSILSVSMRANAGVGLPWWVWFLILIIAFIIMAMLAPKKQEPVVSAPEKVKTMTFEDDLTRIEGIGPKIRQGMAQHGVSTFAQLAKMDIEALREMLREIGIAADPTTWPKQARLAADGDWEALQKLQDDLMGGRKE